jgi:phytoene/squalene synthetase
MPTRAELPPTRALVWLYTPPAQRPLFQALCGIEAEVGASLRPGVDHAVAHARLAWWGEECARTARGAPTHPLTQALAANFTANELAALTQLSGFVDTATWDLAAATYESRAQLRAYCGRWADAMITPLVAPVSADSAAIAAGCRALGALLHEMELLARLADDARVGRLRLTLADLAAAAARPEELARPPWPPALADLLRRRHRQLRAELAASAAGLQGHVQPQLRGLLVWARLASQQSQRCERALPRAPEPRHHHGPLDSWRAWAAARRAAAGHFALTEG